jgi:hypothetical protein
VELEMQLGKPFLANQATLDADAGRVYGLVGGGNMFKDTSMFGTSWRPV